MFARSLVAVVVLGCSAVGCSNSPTNTLGLSPPVCDATQALSLSYSTKLQVPFRILEVTVQGDHLAISVLDESEADLVGKVITYQRSGSDWAESAILLPDAIGNAQCFGRSLALSGDTLVVGSGSVAECGSDPTYVFEHATGAWTQVAALRPDSLDSDSAFGSSVAIKDDYIVVGSPGISGYLQIYERRDRQWTSHSTILGPAGLGVEVAFDGYTIATTARDDLSLHLYEPNTLEWHEVASGEIDPSASDELVTLPVAIGCDLVVAAATFIEDDFATGAKASLRREEAWSSTEPTTNAAETGEGRALVAGLGGFIVSSMNDSSIDGPLETALGKIFVYQNEQGWQHTELLPPEEGIDGLGSEMTFDGATLVASTYQDAGGQSWLYIFEQGAP